MKYLLVGAGIATVLAYSSFRERLGGHRPKRGAA